MKMLRLCLGLLLAVGCAHQASAPAPVSTTAPRPAAPPAVKPPAQAQASAALEPLPSATVFIGCGFLLAENRAFRRYVLRELEGRGPLLSRELEDR
jgi:hypothetical protein